MKRQVAITGPTPEFLRWSIRHRCRLRNGTELDSVDQTEKRLRAIRTAGSAIKSGEVFQGIAVRKIQGQWKGFRLEEIFRLFHGREPVEQCCGDCPANVLKAESDLAGCTGWLPRSVDGVDLGHRVGDVVSADEAASLAAHFLPTEPIWYGFWSEKNLDSHRLEIVLGILRRATTARPVPVVFTQFMEVLSQCAEAGLALDCELVPPGSSDGLRWTVFPHCDRCKAVSVPGQKFCGVCQKSGWGHPEIHRKVLGLRPWVDLNTVLGPGNATEFLKENGLT